MAVLGVGGRLRLRREAPEPTVLRPGNVHPPSRSIYMRNPAFWSGDLVTLSSPRGLPIDLGNGEPGCADGHAAYGVSEFWYAGANRRHISAESSRFYQVDDDAGFYVRPSSDAVEREAFYIYRDQLDRISLYRTREQALRGRPDGRVSIFKVDFHALVVSARGTIEYENAIAACVGSLGDYSFADVVDEVSLESICEFEPEFAALPTWVTDYDNAELTPRYYVNSTPETGAWAVQAYLSEWSLNLSAPEVDTTAVGERFGDSIKSIVTGGGSMDFLVERTDLGSGHNDSTFLLNLLLMTEKGCKADAEFWMAQGREQQGVILPGSLFYETQLMVTSIAINTRADDIIAGSLNFVTNGEIAFRMGQH